MKMVKKTVNRSIGRVASSARQRIGKVRSMSNRRIGVVKGKVLAGVPKIAARAKAGAAAKRNR